MYLYLSTKSSIMCNLTRNILLPIKIIKSALQYACSETDMFTRRSGRVGEVSR